VWSQIGPRPTGTHFDLQSLTSTRSAAWPRRASVPVAIHDLWSTSCSTFHSASIRRRSLPIIRARSPTGSVIAQASTAASSRCRSRSRESSMCAAPLSTNAPRTSGMLSTTTASPAVTSQFTVSRSAEVPPGTANTFLRNALGCCFGDRRSATMTSIVSAALDPRANRCTGPSPTGSRST